eukprot:1181986-Prorocentrum_minimum.AAC.3
MSILLARAIHHLVATYYYGCITVYGYQVRLALQDETQTRLSLTGSSMFRLPRTNFARLALQERQPPVNTAGG